MSQFVLQENSDGTVNLTKKTRVLAEICGKVKYINPKNRTLFSIHAEKMNKDFRCCLNYENPFCPLREGDAVFGVAEYVADPRYGDTLNLIQPPLVILGEDKNTIIKNFVSALHGTGFGAMKANSLIEALIVKTGSMSSAIEALNKMASFYCYKNESDNVHLQPYSHILKEKQMLQLLQWWYKNRNLRMLYLLGINNSEIRKSKMAPEEMYKVCLDNPYKVFSLGIDKCDEIYHRMGKETRPETKACAEISRKLNECMESRGWSGVPTNMLLKMFPNAPEHIEELKTIFNVKTDLHTIYLPYAYEVETEICNYVKNLLDSPVLPNSISPSEIVYTRNDINKEQKLAVEKALTENICIIRGIAGSGKSTIIKELVHNLKLKGIKYKVVSFTGKAVARIREVTDEKDPMTMHMAITLAKKNFDHVIIDEASMVTSELLYEFICKFGSISGNTNFRLTLIGDPNQLMPISYGTLFDQLIKSGIVPTCTLHTCHRTMTLDSDMNGILVNATNIVDCNSPGYDGPPFKFEESDNFNVVEGDVETVKELVTILQDAGTPSNKITVISPFNEYLTEINRICQEVYNSVNRFVKDDQGKIWRINDRVMMTENNYKINVMNGDEGIIIDISDEGIKVSFKDGSEHIFSLSTDVEAPEKTVTETVSEKVGKTLTTSSLILSFCVSVHRYQGSECDFVIFYIPRTKESKFLNRNLLYTGITRAKKIIWMVGDYDTMLRAATTAPAYRCDNLAQRLVKI